MLLSLSTVTVGAFQTSLPQHLSITCPAVRWGSINPRRAQTEQESLAEARGSINDVKKFLSKEYPMFYKLLLSKTDDIWKTLGASNADGGYTIFVPNEAAFQALGEKKLTQLKDDRNLETIQKMALYHVIAKGLVTSQQLRTEDWTAPVIQGKDGALRPYKVGGVITMGGTVPVGRSKSGGFLGWGAKEDGDAVIGPNARITQSYQIFSPDNKTKIEGTVHEVDAFVSPELLWRFMDQLRIPGF